MNIMDNISIIIQARCGSSRLPNKVLKPILNIPLLEHVILRVKRCQTVKNIIVATTINREDDCIVDLCNKKSICCFRGSEDNVLERYYQAALISNTKIIVRITSDCPLIDPNIIDEMIKKFLLLDIDYYQLYYYNDTQSFPDGFDCEIFTFDALNNAFNKASLCEQEHVTSYMKNKYDKHKYKIEVDKSKYKNLSLEELHLSVDTEQDYKLITKIFEHLNVKNDEFTMYDVLDYLNNNYKLLTEQSESLNIFSGKGQQLYEEAKTMIPGGTQLLSKRPEMFLPNHWPSYYQRSSGIEITDLNGNKLKDFSYMGIGCCILGYRDSDVNKEVHKAIDRGNMTTLNCPSEVELTKILLRLHPWAEMARYTRSSGEACAMSIRIARAKSKKDNIAFCGYHGWHDWYLSANLNNHDELGNHLLPGLSPVGVPKKLKNTAFPFNYNKIEELQEIIRIRDIGCVIMEPQRSESPQNDFLTKVRQLCDEHEIILIFDEVTSAFRVNTGGIHLKYCVNPDMMILGKSLGNGYPIASVIGNRKCMSIVEDSFISSTFFTEDVGFIAAIATIKKHESNNVGDYNDDLGRYFQEKLKIIAKNRNIDISIGGISALTTWSFNYKNANSIKTLYVQEMLRRGILAKPALYLSFAHTKKNIDYYLKNIDEVFFELVENIKNNNVEKLLLGPPAHTGFKRLT